MVTGEMNLASIMRSRDLREAYEKGRRKGRDEERREVVEALLRSTLTRHLRRELSPLEQQALTARALVDEGREALEILKLGPEAIWSWLFGPEVA